MNMLPHSKVPPGIIQTRMQICCPKCGWCKYQLSVFVPDSCQWWEVKTAILYWISAHHRCKSRNKRIFIFDLFICPERN